MLNLKTKEEIYNNISQFINGSSVQVGSILDMFIQGVSRSIEKLHEKIDEYRNPHIYSRLEGEDLDDLGYFFDFPREPGEDDNTYKKRIFDWRQSMQKSNSTAIDNALLNLEHTSFAKHIPYTHGTGTGSIYIIPIEMTEGRKELAIQEAKDKIKNIVSEGYYLDFLIPETIPVDLAIDINTGESDSSFIQSEVISLMREYVNNIPPDSVMHIGDINRIGMEYPGVDYFQVIELRIDNRIMYGLEQKQALTKKFILNDITWIQR